MCTMSDKTNVIDTALSEYINSHEHPHFYYNLNHFL